jgi:hypothetical protein
MNKNPSIAFALFVIASAVSGCGAISGEHTVYAIACLNNLTMTGAPTTYKASFEHQAVIFWQSGYRPSRMHDCLVRDRLNWSCKMHESHDSRIDMINGRLALDIKPFKYVSPWTWWWREIAGDTYCAG